MAATITFETFVEDVMDLHVGLMSEDQISAARADYARFCDAAKPKASKKHPEMSWKLADLKSRCERLIRSQKIAVERCADAAAKQAGLEAIAFGEALLAKRATKAEFISHKEMNSDASRAMNSCAN